jgi:hypothetical protein
MKFLCIYKPAKKEGTPPTQQEIERMEKLLAEWGKEGVLLAAEGCLPSALGARLRQTNGKVTVTDGPFTESKELVGGFAIIRTKTKEEAIERTKIFLSLAGDGESEIRQVYEEAGD